MPRPHLPQLPVQAEWDVRPADWSQADHASLDIAAGAATDLFRDPESGADVATSPRLCFPVAGPCLLRARVSVDFRATFDAGALLVYRAPDRWAKLCFERFPEGGAGVVSVVTRGDSDDGNAHRVAGDAVWLRVAVLRRAFAFHASDDGERWRLVRFFALGEPRPTRLGFSSQSPRGAGCTARFRRIGFHEGLLGDVRSGA